MKPSGIGGMAVMEGVMMKNKDTYAVAVRKPNNEIVVEKNVHKDFSDKLKLFKLPVFRGILAFIDSLVLGIKVLNFSASFFEEEETEKTKKSKKKKKKDDFSDYEIDELSATNFQEELNAEDSKKDERANALMMLSAVLFSIVLSIALFMVLPVFLSDLFKRFHLTSNGALINFLEGIIRFAIFIGYVFLASRLNEIKRVFMYHGAEHKTINCIEHGYELTVENVRKQSKEHKRCGTSFTLLVILISLIFFMIIPVHGLLWKIISRIVFVPFIAGVSYEFIRLAGRSESRVVEIISKPGLWMQALTTKEPDDSMIEVAIKSVDAVFDWKAFLKENKESVQEEAAGMEADSVKQMKTKEISQSAEASEINIESEKQTKPVNQTRKSSGSKNASESKKTTVKRESTLQEQVVATKETNQDVVIADKENMVEAEGTAVEKKTSTTKRTTRTKKTDVSENPIVAEETAATETVGVETLEETTIQDITEGAKKPTRTRKSSTTAKSTGSTKSAGTTKPASTKKVPKVDEEDDEILKALDKFFD